MTRRKLPTWTRWIPICAVAVAGCGDDESPTTPGTGESMGPARIVYSYRAPGASLSAVYTMDVSGNDRRMVRERGVAAVFSPDGSRIAFVSGEDHAAGDIFVMNADGTDVVNLTNDPSWDHHPTWSPDGRRLAFDSDRNGDMEIFLIDSDGTGLENLTSAPSSWEEFPSWSPDGTEIAFVSTRTGNDDVHVVHPDGTNVSNVTNHPSSDLSPAWLPDGRLAFTSARTGDSEIYVLNEPRTTSTNITQNTAVDNYPSWSRDGDKVLFRSDRSGASALFLMNADGTGVVNLTADDPNGSFTLGCGQAWSPGAIQP